MYLKGVRKRREAERRQEEFRGGETELGIRKCDEHEPRRRERDRSGLVQNEDRLRGPGTRSPFYIYLPT